MTTIIYGKVPFIEKKKPFLFLLLFLLLGLPELFLSPHAWGGERSQARVLEVYDGDTVVILNSSGKREILRYAGMDTPELHHPLFPQEEFALRAWERNRELVEGRELELLSFGRDRYGRLLGYLFLPLAEGPVPIQEILLREGLGVPRYGSFRDPFYDSFLKAFENARLSGAGFWNLAGKRLFTPSQVWDSLPYLRGHFVTLRCVPGSWKQGPSRILVHTEHPRVFLSLASREIPDTLPKKMEDLSGISHLFFGKISLSYEGALLHLHHSCQIF